MMNQHAKSPCCSASICRFGERRRQCTRCKATWRIRQKKRGRKLKRINLGLLQRILRKTTASEIAAGRHANPSTVQKRCRRALDAVLAAEAAVIPPGRLILLVDGLWLYFRDGGAYTLYVCALRSATATEAYFLDPVLLPGRENAVGWRQAFTSIHPSALQRIGALISDGLRGIKAVAEERQWLFQRCHFHLLAQFQKRHGQWFRRGESQWIRDALTAYVRKAIETTDPRALRGFLHDIRNIGNSPSCPVYLKMRTREFLRTAEDFRTYLYHPDLHLPTTTNSVETMIRLLRSLLGRMHGIRTPDAFLKWSTAFIRERRTIACNGKVSTKFRR